MSICCSYKDCENIQRAFSSKTFFNLPNDWRREVWIKNSGNDKLHGINPTLRRLFCEDHFDPKYMRCQFNRTILRRDAVPNPFDEMSESFEIECIEMVENEDETEEQLEQNQNETSEPNNEENELIIMLNNPQDGQIFTDNIKQEDGEPKKSADTSPAKMLLKKDSNRKQHPPEDEGNDSAREPYHLIVVEEKNPSIESNENGQTPATNKRIRLEIEPMSKNQANESSQNMVHVAKNPPVPMQPRKSIEEIVSSSEAFDTNNEDKYFALSILGTLRRLTPHKRALAKCHILSYLTEIEYGNSNSVT